MKWEWFLFDFNAIAADTEPYHWRCWAEVVQPYGFELNWVDYCMVCEGGGPFRTRAALAKLTPVAG